VTGVALEMGLWNGLPTPSTKTARAALFPIVVPKQTNKKMNSQIATA